MSEQAKNQKYYVELGGSLLLYGIVLAVSLRIGTQLEAGPARTAIFVLPMLPFLLAVCAIVRHLRRVDEFLRRTALEQIAIAAAVTAGWTFTYGFLEIAGYPKLSMFVVWPAMGAVWGVLAMVRGFSERG